VEVGHAQPIFSDRGRRTASPRSRPGPRWRQLRTAAPFDISNAQDFAQQAAAVRSGLQPGGEYAGLRARDRYLATRNFDFMTALIQEGGDIEAMTGSERVRGISG
jgi:hypothetical protein